MTPEIIRREFTNISTIGKMSIDGVFAFYTLELPWNNGANLHQKNCILPGIYELDITYSPHHKRLWPQLLNVPGRDDIRIDIANYPHEILGCIAIGLSKGQDFIGSSKDAWNIFYPKLEAALKVNKVYLTIN